MIRTHRLPRGLGCYTPKGVHPTEAVIRHSLLRGSYHVSPPDTRVRIGFVSPSEWAFERSKTGTDARPTGTAACTGIGC